MDDLILRERSWRVAPEEFNRLRSKALFYFPKLPKLINKLNLTNRALARATGDYAERPLTEGTIRRMVSGEPTGYIRVRIVFDTINALSIKRLGKELKEDDEIVQYLFKLPGLQTYMDDVDMGAPELAHRLDMPLTIITLLLEGKRVCWRAAASIVKVLNEARAERGLASLDRDEVIVARMAGGERVEAIRVKDFHTGSSDYENLEEATRLVHGPIAA